MLSIYRSIKRPYQQVLVVAWVFIIFAWLYVGVQRASQASLTASYLQFLEEHARWPRHSKQTVMPDTTSEYGSQIERISHPRLQERPLPIHASLPDFENMPVVVHLPTDDGSHITEEEVQQYVDSVWDLGDGRFWRTECNGEERLAKRYEILRRRAEEHDSSEVKYYFALDLYESKKILPRLMGTLVQVVKLLGPSKCAVSIVEGRSKDGTYAILSALKDKLETIGARVHLVQSDINPHAKGVDRIGALSELRNMALAPLIAGVENVTTGRPLYNNETVINFINDIAVCPEDIYELLSQHLYQDAHQTCAMDWIYGGDLFYDSWVSRSMSGDLFFEVPQDVSFSYANNMFWDHPLSKHKHRRHQPFQVYSCWGGMVTLSSAPFLDWAVRFRNATDGECYSGEPMMLAKDLWRIGYGRIATIPTVNVGYNPMETSRIKKRKGYVHDFVNIDKTEAESQWTELINWSKKPPGQVKCMPGWGVVSWTEP